MDSTTESVPTRCGYVAIIGRPNVGKSTLLNHLVGQKLSITSRKPQTTRHNLLGVLTEGNSQMLLVDTPGIHQPRDRAINRMMVRNAVSVLKDVDLVLLVIEARGLTADDELVIAQLERTQARTYCLINKIDQLADKSRLLPLIEQLAGLNCFSEIIPVCALRGEGLDQLKTLMAEAVPEGPHLFPPDQLTDRSERFVVSEIVREKLMRRLGDELPHRITVVVDSFQQRDALADIRATIYVERDSQKAIIIGRGGERLKSIGRDARLDIEKFLDCKVMLRLWVKVKEGWTNSDSTLQHLGYD